MEERQRFPCELCAKEYLSMPGLQYHMNAAHAEVKSNLMSRQNPIFCCQVASHADILRRSSRNLPSPQTFVGEEDCVTNALRMSAREARCYVTLSNNKTKFCSIFARGVKFTRTSIIICRVAGENMMTTA